MQPANTDSTIAAQVGLFRGPSVLTSGESRSLGRQRIVWCYEDRIYFAEDTEVDMNWHATDAWTMRCTSFSVKRLPFMLLHQGTIRVSIGGAGQEQLVMLCLTRFALGNGVLLHTPVVIGATAERISPIGWRTILMML